MMEQNKEVDCIDEIVSRVTNGFMEEDANNLVNYSAVIARELIEGKGDNVGTSQMRKILDYINRIKVELYQAKEDEKTVFSKEKLIFLKPKLAYAVSRKSELKKLYSVLVPIIDQIDSKESFLRFAKFYESIVAYHNYYDKNKQS